MFYKMFLTIAIFLGRNKRFYLQYFLIYHEDPWLGGSRYFLGTFYRDHVWNFTVSLLKMVYY